MIDIHNHILPGIDDGPANMEKTGKMLKDAIDNGITTIIATSHYNEKFADEYNAALAETRKTGMEYGVSILRGCEYDLSMLPDIRQFITLADSSFLLIDICLPTIPAIAGNTFFDLALKGYKVILAHPERLFRLKDLSRIEKLNSEDIYYQVNASSITGRNGRDAQKFADELLQRGLCHYIASDAHGTKQRRNHLAESRKMIEKKYGAGMASVIFDENPMRLLDNKVPLSIIGRRKKNILKKILRKFI